MAEMPSRTAHLDDGESLAPDPHVHRVRAAAVAMLQRRVDFPVTSRFEPAVEWLLQHEGGYVDDPHDRGGATNWGISLRFLRTLGWLDPDLDHDGEVDAADIHALTRIEAKEIYRREWWDRYHYDEIVDQAVANKVLDLAVNMGAGRAHRLLQRALRACGRYLDLSVDGVFGPQTRNTLSTELGLHGAQRLLAALRSEAAGYYDALIDRRPDLDRFRNGWHRRALA
jgi:lysozyme family protein